MGRTSIIQLLHSIDSAQNTQHVWEVAVELMRVYASLRGSMMPNLYILDLIRKCYKTGLPKAMDLIRSQYDRDRMVKLEHQKQGQIRVASKSI